MLTKGNAKLSKKVGIFSLPAVETCPNCGDCAGSCYALLEQQRFPTTREHRQRNLTLTKQPEFHRLIANEIISKKISIVRIHESGDFYSLPYLRKWIAIAKSLPTVNFYGYSKCFDRYKTAMEEFNSLPNVNIINSITPEGKKNYGQEDYVQHLVDDLGYYRCSLPHNGKCMEDCKECLSRSKVCFVAHGGRKKRA